MTEPVAQLPGIVVEDSRLSEPGVAELTLEERAKGPVSDGGELLKTTPGVAGSRLGGHGMDPAIRGQAQNRINVLVDGAYLFGGCPNRMDPPTAYATSETYDAMRVIKGAQSLQYGPGGGGGTVLFTRNAPQADAQHPVSGRVGGGYRGNSDAVEGYLDAAASSEKAYVRVIGAHGRGSDYDDGDGNAVRAQYRESTGNLILGWRPDGKTHLEAGFEGVRARDLTYAGAGMDTPYTDMDTWRLKASHQFATDWLQGVDFKLSHAAVDHLMDNYTLRDYPSAMMLMRAPSDSDTLTAALGVDLAAGDHMVRVGVDYLRNDRDAERFRKSTTSAEFTQSYLWPDVRIEQIGLYGEDEWAIDGARRLKLGLRYDHVSASAGKADLTPNDPLGGVAKLSAAGLYAIYYGTTETSFSENNISGLARFEHDILGGDGVFYAVASRTVRTGDANERYMASNNNMSTDSRWVGNPAIEPEKHHQVEIGAQIQRGPWDLDVSLYHDRVSDFILRDRDHGASGAGNATIYRNINASLTGGEAAFNWRWNPQLRSGINLSYVYGEDRTDNRPLPQIPPLEAALTVDYARSAWSVGARARLAAQQNRVDDDAATGTGLDSGQTAGFQTLDLYGSYRWDNGLKLKLGVDNLLDQTYAEHMNRSSAFDVTQTQVNEAGRSLWMTLGWVF
ncbi:putative TonB-dependent copper receptor [Magnetofaba australis IT-1]|uniref:Putative TonB-dependent copper receptor n=1 Tax=Magnetofaba australis IT-1 TaxID=1434232 RepID=A0A1Y2K3F8_9PROT|nr:putative TonB-dependent copper receptor [Magnetofaba australis IT-1]